jgi:Protein of unknown function (DUF3558)
MKTLKPLLPVVALLIAVAACSSPTAAPTDAAEEPDEPPAATPTADAQTGGDGDGGGASGYDLCDAISNEEVSQIAGVEVTDATSADLSGVLSCNYNTADGAVAGTTLATSASGVDPSQLFDANRDAEGNEEIPGLGEGAVLTGDEDFPILMVKVNGNLYSLSVLADNLDGAGKREATIELARLSVDRLP